MLPHNLPITETESLLTMLKKVPGKGTKRVAIVEDEASCLFTLRNAIVKLFPDLEIVFEASSIAETREALKNHPIDLIFLDVQLKDGNSFEILGELSENTRVIFTTGYDSYAVRAFEVNALDYLLKPIKEDRLERAVQIYFDGKKREQTLPLIRPDDDVLLTEEGKSQFVPINDIIYIQSDKDYTHVVTTTKKWFVRRSISSWEEQLPVSLFLRIHRSYLVNEQHIVKTKKSPTGRFEITLKGIEDPLYSSRRYSSRLKRLLAGN